MTIPSQSPAAGVAAECVGLSLFRRQSVLDELPDGVLVVDPDGRVQDVNDAFLELLEFERDQVLGQAMESLVAPEDVLQLLGFQNVFSERRTVDSTVLFLARDGTNRPLVVNSARARSALCYFLTVRASGSVQQELADTTRWAAAEQQRAHDVTQARDTLAANNAALRAAQAELETAHEKLQREVAVRERLEGELRLAQKLEGIGQLAAGIAHEINTPMQYIGDNVLFLSESFEQLRGYWALLQSALEKSGSLPQEERARLASLAEEISLEFLLEQVPRALDSSREGIGHVSGIVKAMKSFARADQGEKMPSDLNQAIRDTLAVAQNEYKNIAAVETDLAELPLVTCYASRLNQVILNLVINAAHAIADSEPSGLGRIKISSRHRDDFVEVTVSDNGCGIPEAIQHRVFDQFFTTKAVGRGTGQGLAIARSIVVDAHGGTLTFETAAGAGTAFTLRIPVEAARR